MIIDSRYKDNKSVIVINADHITIADLTVKRGHYHLIQFKEQGKGASHSILSNLQLIDGRKQFVKVNPSENEND